MLLLRRHILFVVVLISSMLPALGQCNCNGNGHQLVYSLQLQNNKYEDIDFDESTTVAVLYTISD